MSVLNENNDVFIYMQFYKILLYPSTGFAEKQCLLLATLKILIKGLCVFFQCFIQTIHIHMLTINKKSWVHSIADEDSEKEQGLQENII